MASVASSLTTLDYSAAITLLVGYERLCRPSDIRRLIDEAVASTKLVTETPGKLALDPEIEVLLGQLTQALGQPILEADAITLYAWYSKFDRRNDIKTKSILVSKLLTIFGGSDAALEDKLKQTFLPLGIQSNPIGLRWSALVNAVPGAVLPTPVAATSGAHAVAPNAEMSKIRALISAPIVTVRVGSGER